MKRKVRKEVEQENDLVVLVPRYGENNARKLAIEKLVKADGKKIKELMVEQKCAEYTCGGYTATVNNRESATFNEDKLMDYLRENWESVNKKYKIIRTKKYIDYDALENAIYHEAFADKLGELDRFKETKITPVLTVKEVKD